MRLLIMGPPGAGKGTQASLIKEKYNIPHISTGEMFREAISKMTPMGVEAKKYIDRGELVPDKITNELVKERLLQADCEYGFLLDGYPRSLSQAKAFDKFEIQLELVLNIDVPHTIIVDRIVGRRICPNCGAGYHIETLKPKIEGICDVCDHELIQRKDDNKKTIIKRLEVYKKDTKPLLKYYNNKGLLKNVNGEGEIKDIFKDIKLILGGLDDNN